MHARWIRLEIARRHRFPVVAILAFAGTSAILGGLLPRVSAAQASTKGNQERAYFEYEVEQPVAPSRKMLAPQYPQALRKSSLEGSVLAQFVVDTNGVADLGTFVVRKSPDPLFTEAVRDYLAAGKWIPAIRDKRKVRQVVQQEFVFRAPR